MKSEDYLDLPDLITNVIQVDLGYKVLAKYEEFERDQVLALFDLDEDGEASEISAVNAAALSNKLLQFANGAVYDEHKEYHEVHSAKLDILEELVEASNGKPMLVAWAFRHDLYRIQKRL